jgi:hypothetical protein
VRLPLVPREELVEAEVIHASGDRGGNAVEDECLQAAPIILLFYYD